MSIGNQIKTIRLQKHMTQKQVADACGMADSAIRKYESGIQTPKLDTIRRIAKALGVEWNDLVPADEQAETVIHHMKDKLGALNCLDDRLMNAFHKLNAEGQQKAVERLEELTEIPKYQV